MLKKTNLLSFLCVLFLAVQVTYGLDKLRDEEALKAHHLAESFSTPTPPIMEKKDAKQLLIWGSIEDLVPLFKKGENEQATQNAALLTSICTNTEEIPRGPSHRRRFVIAFKLFQCGIALTDDEGLQSLLATECHFDHSFHGLVEESVLEDEAMYAYFQKHQDLMRHIIKGKNGYISRWSCESLTNALPILQDPKCAYPSLIRDGESSLRTAEGRLKDATEFFNDRSYSNRLFSRFDGVCNHYQHLMWGFDALEEAFRTNQKAQVHFAKLRQKQIPFEAQLASRLTGIKGNLMMCVKLAQSVPQNLATEGLFESRNEEEIMGMIKKRVSVAEELLKTLEMGSGH